MGRRQPQHPPPPAAHAAAGARTPEDDTSLPGGSSKARRGGGASASAGTSRRRGSSGSAQQQQQSKVQAHAYHPQEQSGQPVAMGEETERRFWELVFTRHERLRVMVEDVRLSTAARARQLARIHCAHLFHDLVFVGLDAQQGLVGFHGTERLTTFLHELEVQSGLAPSAAAVEAFMRDYRPDFLRYLRVPSRATADQEYLLLGDAGKDRALDLRAAACGDCYATHLTGGMPVQIPGLKYHSDVPELYLRLTEVLPQAKPTEVVLRLYFRDREDALAEVIMGGTWNAQDGRYEWSCVPLNADVRLATNVFDPNERLCQPQLAEMGIFLPTTEVTMCTRGCVHSYTVQNGPPSNGASSSVAFSMMAPMGHDLMPYHHADGGEAFPADRASTKPAASKRGSGSSSSTTAKRASAAGAASKAKKGAVAAAASVAAGAASATTTTMPVSSSTFPFEVIEPGPVHFAGGGGGKSGKSKPTKRYTCCAPGCTQSATFKPADEPRSKNNMVCVRHACKGMSCIKGPLCDHPECVHEDISSVPRRATFGFPDERQRRCGKHKLDGMLYATELVKKRDDPAPKRGAGGARKKKAPTASAAAATASSSYLPDKEDDLGLGQVDLEEDEEDYSRKNTKRRRGGVSTTGRSSLATALGEDDDGDNGVTEEEQQDAADATAFPAGLAAAAAAAAAGATNLLLAEADEERAQQLEGVPAPFTDERHQQRLQGHPQQQHHSSLHYPSNYLQSLLQSGPLSQSGPPSSQHHLLDGGTPQSFADLGNHPGFLAALGDQAGEAFRNLLTRGNTGDCQLQLQPSPATAAAAAAIAAAIPPHMLNQVPPMLHQLTLPPAALAGMPPPGPQLPVAVPPQHQPAAPQQQQLQQLLMMQGMDGAAQGGEEPMRFDLLCEAASKDGKKGGDAALAMAAGAAMAHAQQQAHQQMQHHQLAMQMAAGQQQGQQQQVPLDGVWAELASPNLGTGGVMLGLDDMFSRTPKAHQHSLHSASAAPVTSSSAGPLAHDVQENGGKAEDGSRSVWAGDVAAVVLCRVGAWDAASPFEASDEGIYYVKTVSQWKPEGSLIAGTAEGKTEGGSGKKPSHGLIRELVRVSDVIDTLPDSNPPQQVSSLAACGGVGQAALVLVDEQNKPLGLGLEAYATEKGAGGVPTRAPRRLVLGWSPANGGELEVDFHHRPCGMTISEQEASFVLRPLGPRGPWMETVLTDFARQGLALGAGDLLALLQGAVRVRRDAALHGSGTGSVGLLNVDVPMLRDDDCEEGLSPEHELPLEVLDGPLGPAAMKVASFFLTAGTQQRPRFTPASFMQFVANAFGASKDLFGAATRVWADLSTVSEDFCRFQGVATAAAAFGGEKNGLSMLAAMSPRHGSTAGPQRCLLRLSEVERQCMVLEWCAETGSAPAAFGLDQWPEAASAPPVRPKGLLLRWVEEAEEHGGKLVWQVEEPQLQALLAEQAKALGLDSTSLGGLVAAVREASGSNATPFMEAWVAAGQRQANRRYVGAY